MDGNEDFFDFEEVAEEEEKLDFQHLKPCPRCRKPIPSNSLRCLYCGEPVYTHKKNKWLIILVIIVLVSFLLLILR